MARVNTSGAYRSVEPERCRLLLRSAGLVGRRVERFSVRYGCVVAVEYTRTRDRHING